MDVRSVFRKGGVAGKLLQTQDVSRGGATGGEGDEGAV